MESGRSKVVLSLYRRAGGMEESVLCCDSSSFVVSVSEHVVE